SRLVGKTGLLGGIVRGSRIEGIVVENGASGGGYSFAAPSTFGRIAGRVFLDLYHDHAFGPGDFGVATIRIVLTGVDDHGVAVHLTTTTASDGSFAFEQLR